MDNTIKLFGIDLKENDWVMIKQSDDKTLLKKARDCLMMGLEEHIHRYQDISGRYMSGTTGVFQHSMGPDYKDPFDAFKGPDFDEVDIVAWFNEKGIDVTGLLWEDMYKPRTDYINWLKNTMHLGPENRQAKELLA